MPHELRRRSVDVNDLDAEVAGEHLHDHLSPSLRRRRPLSTKTQVSWSPMARCSSAATTDGIDAAGKAEDHLLLPTCARTFSIASLT